MMGILFLENIFPIAAMKINTNFRSMNMSVESYFKLRAYMDLFSPGVPFFNVSHLTVMMKWIMICINLSEFSNFLR
jgi:hypothetical protein